MKYTPQQLRDLAPILAATVQRAPMNFQLRGAKLLQAIDTVTRCADLLQPIVGDQIGDIAASYLLPQIHSYMAEVSGRAPTPPVIQFVPVALLSAQKTGLFENMGRIFGASEGMD